MEWLTLPWVWPFCVCGVCSYNSFLHIYEEKFLLLKSEGSLSSTIFPQTPKGASSDQLRCGQPTFHLTIWHHRNQYSLIYLSIGFSHLLPVFDYQRTGYVKNGVLNFDMFVFCLHISTVFPEKQQLFLTFSKNAHIYSLSGSMCLDFLKYLKNQIIFLIGNDHYSECSIHTAPGLYNEWIWGS